jgi:RimJ/RimL family protein N-acetyltransferase
LEYLETGRINLRPITKEDARDIFSYRSDPEVYKYQAWKPKTIADVEEFVETRIVSEPNLPDTWFQLAMRKNGHPDLIGDCGIHFMKNEPGQVEIGITLRQEDQGYGYATEASGLIFKYVFGDLKKHRIIASVEPNNLAAIRLLERMEMRREAHVVESTRSADRRSDDIVYAISASEWRAKRQ